MLNNYDTTNGQAGQGPVASAWLWLAAGFARALRQARGHSTASDVAARLAACGVRSTGHHEAGEHLPGEVWITRDIYVQVVRDTMRAQAFDGDAIKYYPDRDHGDLAAMVQDILEAHTYVAACLQEQLSTMAAPDWQSTAAADLAAHLARRGVHEVRLVRQLDAQQTGCLEVGSAPPVHVEVIADDCFAVEIAADTGMSLRYPLRQDPASLVADIEDAKGFVFPPCRPLKPADPDSRKK